MGQLLLWYNLTNILKIYKYFISKFEQTYFIEYQQKKKLNKNVCLYHSFNLIK